MILVTVGTNEQPFDRLVRAAAALDGRASPSSSSTARPRGRAGARAGSTSSPFDELAELARQARVVVCHAGVGSIMLARRCRQAADRDAPRHHLGEAVDDHQRRAGPPARASGLVTLVEDESDLASAVRTVSGTGGETVVKGLPGAAALAADLRTQLQRIAA